MFSGGSPLGASLPFITLNGMKRVHVIIPAGGVGSRLWPLSRKDRPKFLLDLRMSGKSLLQETIDRLDPVAQSFTIVTGKAHEEAVRSQIPQGRDITVLVEPQGRDSMPAIGFAAYIIRQRFGDDAPIASFAADHAITHPDVLLSSVSRALDCAERDYVVTVGLSPSSPSTAYGYIAPGDPFDQDQPENGAIVRSFVEKPDEQTARAYVEAGYLWNAGMFITTAGTLARRLAQFHPDMDLHLSKIAEAWGSADFDAALDKHWPLLTKIAIDHAIAEPLSLEGGVAVVPARDMGWTDVGDFDALADISPQGEALRIDSPQTFVRSLTGQKIVLVGAENLAVIATRDAILVVDRNRAQDVKKAVDSLSQNGQTELL